MKSDKRFLLVTVIMLAAYVLSACGGAPVVAPVEQAGAKVNASLVAYTGTIESMNGSQWVINGQSLTVDQSVVRDGPFQVGDIVKVEGNVKSDGSFEVSRVEAPSAADLTAIPPLGDDNANANDNASNANDTNTNINSNDNNSNDDGANLNSNDDDSNGNSNGDSNMNSNGDDNDDDSGGSGKNSNDGDEDDGGDSNENDD